MTKKCKLHRTWHLALALLVFLFLNACSRETYQLPAVYSDPKTGRVFDFGPQGLYAEKQGDTVLVGRWSLDESGNLSLINLTHPLRGVNNSAELEIDAKEIKMTKPGAEVYETYLREPEGKADDSSLVGLWKRKVGESYDFYEFTPWGSCMWVRLATHTGGPRIVGGSALCTQIRPGFLSLRGREFDNDIVGFDNYTYSVEGQEMVATNTANKEVSRYQKVAAGELAKFDPPAVTPPSSKP